MTATRSDLAAAIERLKDAHVLCVGDVMLDRYVYGAVERISPEAPIPVLRMEREAAMLGGAGNVVRNLSALGAHVAFASVVGNDQAGREISALVAAHDKHEPYLSVERGRMTTVKTRYVAGGQQLLRTDRETLAPLAPSVAEDLRRVAVGAVADASVIVLSDYGKGVLTPELMRALIDAGRTQKRPVVVDPKGKDFSRYRGATVLTPNRAELAAATGMPVGTDEEIGAAAGKLIAECALESLLVTRGADGMTLFARGGEVTHLPAEAREVFDVSGAGDTVVAMLAAALAAGVTLPDAARLANVAAGIVVGKTGTAVATADEVFTALHTQDLLADESKIAAHDDALARVERWRKEGLVVGFTNGVFDLLHPGHVTLLSQAKAACDRLVVGLNSDASVKRLKGPTRPVQNESARSAVLASLAAVDLVTIFGEDTPLSLIEQIRPDVLVKGSDYTIETVVGAEVVQRHGGRVILAELLPGHSTTGTIAKLTK
ncbi:MAG: D-glycero-beta-D-manno-heptose-7-phosphate kinase [Alphaproteobacteria bacterium]|nr:D-glycero-beta-D-manno-heptose-7-phosphate kinase [Alphaproteobacteria bacterium]